MMINPLLNATWLQSLSGSKDLLKVTLVTSLLLSIAPFTMAEDSYTLLTPETTQQHFYLGLSAYQNRKYALAIPYFQSAVRQNPSDANELYYLADCYFQLRRFDEAIAAYQRVITLSPNSQSARLAQESIGKLEADRYKSRYPLITSGASASTIGHHSASSQSNQQDKLSGLSFSTAASDQYLDDITTNDQHIRWSVLKLPLLLYVEEHPNEIKNFQPTFIAQVKKAWEVWMSALNRQMTYRWVNDKESADITISWTNRLNSTAQKTEEGSVFQAGITEPQFSEGLLNKMRVTLAVFRIDGTPQSPEMLYSVALHELGHALGLLGHSKNVDDVMAAASAHSKSELSPRDLNTIRMLYSKPAEITNQENNTDKGPIDVAKRKEKAIETIKLAEKALAKGGTNQEWLNLSALYVEYARSIEGNEKESYLKKAMQAADRSIELDPQYGYAYQNRAQLLQKNGNLEKAYLDSQKAIQFLPTHADVWEFHANLLFGMGRKAEAKDTLNQLLNRFPEARHQSSITNLKARLQ